MDEDQHKSPDAGPSRAAGVGPVDMSAMTAAERAVDELLGDAHFAAAHHLPDLVARHAATMGVTDAVMYLADLQQQLLVPFLSGHAAFGERPTALGVDSTVVGRAFQQVQVLTQDGCSTAPNASAFSPSRCTTSGCWRRAAECCRSAWSGSQPWLPSW